jgi:spermidine/putrescine ABC transporter ATP-binding subunit
MRVAPHDQVVGAATQPTSMVHAIELRGVTKRYGAHLALQATDLAVRDGEFFCLLGPSGCGKTTLLNLIGGFIGQTSGSIHVGGRCVDGTPPNKRDINTVFQSYALFPHMTVEANVGFGLKMSRVPKADAKARVEEALERVGLAAWGGRMPGQLSGGQQQRVAVARALVNRPTVLLLDEPLGALDLQLRRHLQFELAAIQRDLGTTFIYVTHDQEEAMAMADRIAVLSHGQIEQVGTPEDIYERPKSRFVADFIGESNFLTVVVEDADTGRIALPTGDRLPPATIPAGRQGECTLMVRPHAIQVASPDSTDDAIVGQVQQVVFLGSHRRVVVSCNGVDTPLVIAVQGQGQSDVGAELVIGTRVALCWERKAAVVLNDDAVRGEGSENGRV